MVLIQERVRSKSPNILDGFIEEELLIPALNNMALCALYTCKMNTAVEMLEGLVRENPTRYLTECTVFNLCTLYELGSDNAVSERKKEKSFAVAREEVQFA